MTGARKSSRPGRADPGRAPTSVRPRRRRNSLPRIGKRPATRRVLLWFAAGVAALVLIGFASVLLWATRPGPGAAGITLARFEGNESAREVAERLQQLGLVSSPRLFELYLGWFSFNVRVAPGAHLLRGGLTARDLVQRLGRMAARATEQVVLPEGLTYPQIADRLEQHDICFANDFRNAVRDPKLLAELGLRGNSAEGYLFPAKYRLAVDSEANNIVHQLVIATRKRFVRIAARAPGALTSLAQTRGWGEREVLTLASMVERETAAPDERALIASVFFNRLDSPDFRPPRMLQSDPTAAYGCLVAPEAAPSCAGFNGKVSAEMLRDPANAYNTYRHPGLPPGPIGNPGEDALLAVLNPAKSDYLYFVADGHGRHHFSRTFDEHRKAIRGDTP